MTVPGSPPRWRARIRSSLTPLVWANFGVVTLVTVIAGVAGLVAEDLLRKRPEDGDLVVWYRVVVLLALLAALLGALWLRSRVHRTTGTIFHVQVLAEEMADLRASSRIKADADRMAVRSVTRWVDLTHRTSPAGVIEVADVCAEVSDIVEAQINADSIDTGYTLAPNMLWPIALAVGTQLPLPGRLQLYELDAGHELEAVTVDLAGPGRNRLRVRRDLGDSATGRVGVLLAFTGSAARFPPDVWRELGVGTDYRIDLPDVADGQRLGDDDLVGLGSEIAEKLVEIKTSNQERELVVVAFVPKTLAVAIGWHLAQQQCRFFHGTHLMHYDQPTRSYLPMRVKESQPDHAPRAI